MNMSNNTFSPYTFSSESMFTKDKGIFLVPVGNKKLKYYPQELKINTSHVFKMYNETMNDPNFIAGHGMYWEYENIKIVLSLCLYTKGDQIVFDYNTFGDTLSVMANSTTNPIFMYLPFFTEFTDFEWLENFIDRLDYENKFYFSIGKDAYEKMRTPELVK